MSDYLSNVVARGLNLTEVIQPRLAGLFEPPYGAGGTVAEPPLGIGNREAPAVLDNATPGATLPDRLEPTQPVVHPPLGRSPGAPSPAAHPPSPITLSDESPGDIPGIPGHRRVKGQGGLKRPLGIEGSEVAIPTSRVDRSGSLSVPGRSPKVLPAIDSPQSAPLSVAAAREVDRASDRGPQPSHLALESFIEPIVIGRASEPPNINQPATVREGAAIPLGHAPLPHGPPLKLAIQHAVIEQSATPERPPPPAIDRVYPSAIQTVRSPASSPVMVQPRVTPYVKQTAPVPREPLEATQPAPTIQVTIGRIEVRATSPSAPRSRRPAPPVMSLDDYLNPRARGRDDR